MGCVSSKQHQNQQHSRKPPPIKRGAVVGLNYTNTSAALSGCINDANRMKETLERRFHYDQVSVYTDPDLKAGKSIIGILDELVTSNSDVLFFQYSGHGTQTYDWDGDESDGKDEALYSVNGRLVTDDDINKVISKLPNNKLMVLVIDACHSGTIIDLPYILTKDRVKQVNNKHINSNVICISGCRDDQVSLDVCYSQTYYGAMSNSLQKVLQNADLRTTTWKQLVLEVRKDILTQGFTNPQVPQLTVSRPELINSVIQL